MADIFGQLAGRLKTPRQVQKFLRGFAYNREEHGETLRSGAEALKTGKAHCLEAAFIAAAILERHGHEPLVVSLESQDHLDHVIYVFQENGRWGSIARSRDEGLNGRPAIFRSLRQLCWSYYEPYIDKTGMIKAYQVYHLDESGVDWRYSKNFVWKVEKELIDIRHIPMKTSHRRYTKIHQRYLKKGPMKTGPHWW